MLCAFCQWQTCVVWGGGGGEEEKVVSACVLKKEPSSCTCSDVVISIHTTDGVTKREVLIKYQNWVELYHLF